MTRYVAAAVLVLALAVGARGPEFFVSPAGSAAGNGSRERLWGLATALGHPPAVKPGDTLWLLGGTYKGPFRSSLTGAQDKPILVRQAPGERAVLDGVEAGTRVALTVQGAWTWHQDFEIMNSLPRRYVADYMKTYPNAARSPWTPSWRAT